LVDEDPEEDSEEAFLFGFASGAVIFDLANGAGVASFSLRALASNHA